jgi:CRP/FNR family transcriptional regulator
LKQLQRFALLDIHPAGKVLYAEGQPVEGVYILCNGRAKISTTSERGSVIILKIALAGEALGLEAALMNRLHRETAELLDSCQVKFIAREKLLPYFFENPQVALKAALQVSLNCDAAREQVRRLGFSISGTQKLAHLLMLWANQSNCGRTELSFTVPYTHEEIAQMIGSTRETVTRALIRFRSNGVIAIQNNTFIVRDMERLAELTEGRSKPNCYSAI